MTLWADLTDEQLGDRLADDLRSLADNAEASDDWTTRRLLPAVREQAGPRPQRVGGSRLAPVAALGVVAGVLVLFAVAAPRFGPGGPATPTPDPTPPSSWISMNTRDFSAALAAGGLRGETVVVTGELIGQLVSCDAIAPACPLYVLAGTEPPVEIHVRLLPAPEGTGQEIDLPGHDWRWWVYPEPPPEYQSVLLSVGEGGLVDYIGWQSEAPTGVISFPLVDPASWSQSEVAVVPGWLAGLRGPIKLAPGGYVLDLPQRVTGPPTWLLDHPLALDQAGYTPPDDGVRLQNLAFWHYATGMPETQVAEPIAGLWAIAPRLEGGGCPGEAETCWQWNVVARVSYEEADGLAEPVQTPEQSPDPSPTQASPSPTGPTPSPQPAPPTEMACPYGDQQATEITIIDHAGLVVGCSATVEPEGPAPDGVTVTRPVVDERRLVVAWPVDPCFSLPARIELWQRSAEQLKHLGQDAKPYVLHVERLPPTEGSGCFLIGTRTQAITLDLALNIGSDKVEAFLSQARESGGARAQASPESSVGEFTLQMEATTTTYFAGDPINVSAEFAYAGATTPLLVSGARRGFALEQLDGDLAMSPVFTADCRQTSISTDEPWQFEATNHMGGVGEPADFYRRWRESEFLWLPAGYWRVKAFAWLSPGSGCGPERIELEASVVLHVVERDADKAIPLLTSPPNPDGACPGAAGTGTLVAHPESGVGLRDWHGDVWAVMWPNGFTASGIDDAVVLFWPDGSALASEGDNLRFGGAYYEDSLDARDHYIYACTGFEVLPAGPLPTP